jgi:hypothetical protein
MNGIVVLRTGTHDLFWDGYGHNNAVSEVVSYWCLPPFFFVLQIGEGVPGSIVSTAFSLEAVLLAGAEVIALSRENLPTSHIHMEEMQDRVQGVFYGNINMDFQAGHYRYVVQLSCGEVEWRLTSQPFRICSVEQEVEGDFSYEFSTEYF